MIFSSILAFMFLYFPDDKSEYIPAVINLIIFSFLETGRKKGKGIRRTFKEACSRKG
jgi:hypothetical protein